MKKLIVLAVILVSCDPPTPPRPHEECVEFAYDTVHAGVQVTCQMLFCNKGGGEYHMGSGLAVLWCDPKAPAQPAHLP